MTDNLPSNQPRMTSKHILDSFISSTPLQKDDLAKIDFPIKVADILLAWADLTPNEAMTIQQKQSLENLLSHPRTTPVNIMPTFSALIQDEKWVSALSLLESMENVSENFLIYQAAESLHKQHPTQVPAGGQPVFVFLAGQTARQINELCTKYLGVDEKKRTLINYTLFNTGWEFGGLSRKAAMLKDYVQMIGNDDLDDPTLLKNIEGICLYTKIALHGTQIQGKPNPELQNTVDWTTSYVAKSRLGQIAGANNAPARPRSAPHM